MGFGSKTVVTALVGAALVATLAFNSRRDRTTLTNEISDLVSKSDREKSQTWPTVEDIANTRNQRQGNTLTEILKSLKGLEKGFKRMQINMKKKETAYKRQFEALHRHLDDARVSSRMQNVKDPLRITEWWQASSLLKWDWEKPPEYMCAKTEMRGNWHVCNDSKFEVKPPCLVYSFGIWNDWSFDDAMGARGCEVHSFDPSIGLKPFDRSKNVHFHDLGLSGNDSDTYVPTKDIYVKKTTTWKIRRLKTIMEMLGHTDRDLDVLKIDIETSEWPAVKDIVESGLFSKVRQFSVEWHLFPKYPSKSEFIGFYENVMAMKRQGLRTFRSSFHTKDYRKNTFRVQADVNYVNTLYNHK